MTLPNLTSPTEELIAYRDTLKAEIDRSERERSRLLKIELHNTELLIEVLDLINRRESCQHPGLIDGTCSGCGLPADELPFMTTVDYIDEAGQEWPFADTRREASETETK